MKTNHNKLKLMGCSKVELRREFITINNYKHIKKQKRPQIQNLTLQFKELSSVQLLSCVPLFATPWIAARQASLSITISRSSPRPTSIKSVMPSSHLILGCPLLLLPPISPSIRVFSNESTLCMRCPKYWSFSFSTFLPKKSQGWWIQIGVTLKLQYARK